MASWSALATDALWRNAWGVIPLAIVVAGLCRVGRIRPATRHALWLIVLLCAIAPPMPAWLRSVQVFSPRTAETGRPEHVLTPENSKYFAGREEFHSSSFEKGVDVRQEMGYTSTYVEETQTEERETRPPDTARGLDHEPTPPRTVARTGLCESEWLAPIAGSVGRLFTFLTQPCSPWWPRCGIDVCLWCEERAVQFARWTAEGIDSIPGGAVCVPNDQNDPSPSIESCAASSERIGSSSDPSPAIAQRCDLPADVEKPDSSSDPETPRAWRRWVAGAMSLRDTLASLPPIPTHVWVGGALAVVLLRTIRMLRFRWRIRRSAAAPADVVRIVRQASRRIGLRGVPQIRMVEARVSPMIWCGRAPRLLLPSGLWDELDDAGRRAVVLHELAHLKRRDHWVSWVESIVGGIYWWHPVMWWIRRRLREEAEFCCDAWVTWILPRGRRAYAEALLLTQQFADKTHPLMSEVGIGVLTPRARPFARRLTMVMTDHVRPRVSIPGIMLAVIIGAGAWMATPAQSCPPESDDAAPAPPAPAALTVHPVPPVQPTPPVPPIAPAAIAMPAGASAIAPVVVACPPEPGEGAEHGTYEKHMSQKRHAPAAAAPGVALIYANPGEAAVARAGGAAAGTRLEQRLARLEKQLAEMREEMARLRSPRGGFGALTPAPRTTMNLLPPGQSGVVVESLPGTLHLGQNMAGLTARVEDDGNEIIRTYKISGGKLKALSELMVRSDVPVLVRPLNDGIEVHGTARQHDVFQAFVRMIDPRAETPAPSPRTSENKQDKEKKAQAEQRAKMRSDATRARESARDAARESARVSELQSALRALSGRARTQSRERQAELQALLREANGIRSQADRMRTQAERMRERGEDARERNTDPQREKARAMRDQADEIKRQMKELEARAKELEARAKALEKAAERLQEKSEALKSLSDVTRDSSAGAVAKAMSDAARTIENTTSESVATAVKQMAMALETAPDNVEAALQRLTESLDNGNPESVIPLLERITESVQEKSDQDDDSDDDHSGAR